MMHVYYFCFLCMTFCFCCGLYFWTCDLFFKKPQPNFTTCSLESLQMEKKWVCVFCLCFIIIPVLFSKIGFFCLSFIEHKQTRILFTTFIAELALFAWTFFFVRQNKNLSKLFYPFKREEVFSLIFQGLCKSFPWVLCLSLLWNFILEILIYLHLPVTIDPQPVIQLLSQVKDNPAVSLCMGISVVILAPLCEEVFFRGFLLRFFYSRVSLTKSLWITSFLFALAHQHVASFLPLLGLGYGLGWYYIRSNNIYVSIGIHSLFNFFNFLSLSYCF